MLPIILRSGREGEGHAQVLREEVPLGEKIMGASVTCSLPFPPYVHIHINIQLIHVWVTQAQHLATRDNAKLGCQIRDHPRARVPGAKCPGVKTSESNHLPPLF